MASRQYPSPEEIAAAEQRLKRLHERTAVVVWLAVAVIVAWLLAGRPW